MIDLQMSSGGEGRLAMFNFATEKIWRGVGPQKRPIHVFNPHMPPGGGLALVGGPDTVLLRPMVAGWERTMVAIKFEAAKVKNACVAHRDFVENGTIKPGDSFSDRMFALQKRSMEEHEKNSKRVGELGKLASLAGAHAVDAVLELDESDVLLIERFLDGVPSIAMLSRGA